MVQPFPQKPEHGVVTTASAVNDPNSTAPITAAGDYTMTWTITNGLCVPSSDAVIVHVDETPSTSVAGTDKNTCASSVQLTGNDPSVGTGLWSFTSGTSGSSFGDVTVFNTSLNGIQDNGS